MALVTAIGPSSFCHVLFAHTPERAAHHPPQNRVRIPAVASTWFFEPSVICGTV